MPKRKDSAQALILVTGAAGFIGAFLCRCLLEEGDACVVGFDNVNDYYDVGIKEGRLRMLAEAAGGSPEDADVDGFSCGRFEFVRGDLADEAAAEALSLITEIGTNIRRHAPAGDDSYLLFVTLSPEWIEIRETNDIRDDADAQSGLSAQERSGRGLAMHRTRVQELGGELTTRSDDGTWMIYVRIPCVRG